MAERSTLRLFAHFFRANPARTVVMVVLLVASGLAEGFGFFTLVPVLEVAAGDRGGQLSGVSQAIADILGALGLPLTLGPLLAVVVVAMALKAFLLWLAMLQVGYTVAQVTTDLRKDLIRALLRASWSHFGSHPAGYYAAAISNEAHRASGAFREALSALAGLVRVLAYAAVAVVISWQVALLAIGVAVFVLYMLKGLVEMSRSAGNEQTQVVKELIGRLTEALPGIKPVKAMGREEYFLPVLEQETEDVNRALRKQVLASQSLKTVQEPILIAILAVGLYATLAVGSQPFSSVLVLAVIFYRLVGTVGTLQGHYQELAVNESAFWSVTEHIRQARAAEERISDGGHPGRLDREIAFDQVSFTYDVRPILNRVSFRIRAGSFTALMGPSGSGKTTLLDLLVGLHAPTSGKVSVDGIDLQDIDMASWRRSIGYVPQEMLLFRGSVAENVALGDGSLTRDDVVRALRDAGAWEFVSEHPEGIDRLVGEGGVKLSGGQRQRIALARALVGRPQLLILDEATTALDPKTELEVCDTLRSLAGKVTILAVSHQPALRDVAEEVFEVDAGRVIARTSGQALAR